jgi:hypothetical protein
MSTTAVNPYAISMDELRQLAHDQPLPPPEPTPTAQPRDEQGRFVAVQDPPVDDTPTDAPPQADDVVPPQADAAPVEEFTATIDIGDGSGVQVFSAPTKDELLEKLIEAQENATRKIRELNARPTPPPTPTPEPTVNLDDEAALAQAILSEPSAAIRRVMEQELGMSVKEAKAKILAADELARGQQEVSAANQFMAANPDYYVCPSNANKIDRLLKLNNAPATVENIQKAYEELKADGLLTAKPVETPARTARSSGISVRTVTPPAPKPVEDLSKLTREQLFERAGGYAYKF